MEALEETLIENPWGTLLYRDELDGLLRAMNKPNQENARSFYLQAYDAQQSYTSDRIGRGHNRYIDRPCLAMLGGIQPGKLSSYVHDAMSENERDDGLLQRLSLLVWPDINPNWQNIDRPPNTEAAEAIRSLLRELDALEPVTDPHSGAQVAQVYRFDDEAQEVFNAWLASLEPRLRNGALAPALESHLAKYRKTVPALALLCALAEGQHSVDQPSILRALAWVEYLEQHACRLYEAGSQYHFGGAIALLEKIRDGALADGFRPADVYTKGWSALSDADSVREAADLLCKLKHLREDRETSGKGGGRPSLRYRINPLTLQR